MNEKPLSAFWFSKQSRRTQGRYNKQRERATIRRITSPGRIRVCLKLKRARTREEQPARASTTKISKNLKEVSVMKLGGCRDKLTLEMNNIGDVRTSDPR